jgi:predicted permease
MLEALGQEIRHAARTLRRAPGVSLLIVATLATVIAATTGIFSLTNALLLRPVAGEDPDRLVRVYANRASNPWYADYLEFRDRSTTLDLAAFDDQRVSVRRGIDTHAAFGELVTANYFAVVGIPAAIGRMLRPEDGLPGAVPVAIVSDRYWREQLGAAPDVAGRPLVVNNAEFVVAGVAPASFHGAYGIYSADLWIPITQDSLLRPGAPPPDSRASSRGVQIVGRLRPGASILAAQTDLAAIAADIEKTFPSPFGERTASVHAAATFPPGFDTQIALFLGILLTIAVVLVLAACANVGNILLARGATKQRDLALRQAIGASRWRLVRQQLVEGLVMSTIAAAAALGSTWWLTRFLTTVSLSVDRGVPVVLDFMPDSRVLLLAMFLAALTTLLCSLAPALHGTRGDLLSSLKLSQTTASSRSRLRSAFVVAQVASSVLLLVVAGLFLRSLGRVNTIDLGMDTSHVLLMSIDTETRGYSEERAQQFYSQLLDRVAATPGVRAASLADTVPLTLNDSGMTLSQSDPAAPRIRVSFNAVSRGIFSTLGIRLLEGRDFNDDDSAGSRPVVIINEALARRLFGARPAIGQRLAGGGRPGTPGIEREVIGVAGNASYQRIGEEQSFFAYFPIGQMFSPAPTLMVRTSGDPGSMAPAIRSAVRSLDDGLPVFGVNTLEAASLVTLLPARLAAGVSGALGALVLVLSTVGLYGVVAFMVRQRRREIGIRMSLGATTRDVAGLFLRQSVRWAAIGIAIGVTLAVALTRVIGGFLFGISPLDAPTFAGAVALLLVVTCIASYAPARRAAAVNPVDALRAE